MKISTSILSTKDKLDCIKKLNNTNTDYIHIDTMDGIFVKNTSLPIEEINLINKITKKRLDIHLMVENPIFYINNLNNMNIEYITFHLELNQNINEIISNIKEKNYKVGISIKPNTKVKDLLPYLQKIDLVLIMSVEPGYGGQEFIPNTLNKIEELSKIIKENNYNIEIEVDGGINDTNINSLINAGANIAVSGSFITNANNYQEQINKLKDTSNWYEPRFLDKETRFLYV